MIVDYGFITTIYWRIMGHVNGITEVFRLAEWNSKEAILN